MPELVHEDVRRPHAVGGHRAVQAVDAAAAVGRAVGQDLDDFVGRVRRDDRGTPCSRTSARSARNRRRRTSRRPATGGRCAATGARCPDCAAAGDSPQTLISLLPFLERRGREQGRDEPPRVALEFRPLARGVAVAEDQQIQLLRRIAALVQLDQAARRPALPRRAATNLSAGSTFVRPDVAEHVPGVALLDDDAHRRVGSGEAQRLGERAVDVFRFAGRFPLAVDRAEAARVPHRAGRGVGHLEEILAAVGACRSAGPDFPATAAARARRGRG